MSELVHHLVKGLVSHPDAVSVNVTEAEASLLIELRVHDDDIGAIHGPDGQTLRALRQVLSASSGQRRAVLEVYDPAAASADADESVSDGPTAP